MGRYGHSKYSVIRIYWGTKIGVSEICTIRANVIAHANDVILIKFVNIHTIKTIHQQTDAKCYCYVENFKAFIICLAVI